jgi:hypothetical protein
MHHLCALADNRAAKSLRAIDRRIFDDSLLVYEICPRNSKSHLIAITS